MKKITSTHLSTSRYRKKYVTFSVITYQKIVFGIFSKKDVYLIFQELNDNKIYEKSVTEKAKYGTIQKIKNPQVSFNEKETNDPRVQQIFKPSSDNNFSIFIFSQDCYKLPERTTELMEISIPSLNLIFSETSQLSISIKQVRI